MVHRQNRRLHLHPPPLLPPRHHHRSRLLPRRRGHRHLRYPLPPRYRLDVPPVVKALRLLHRHHRPGLDASAITPVIVSITSHYHLTYL